MLIAIPMAMIGVTISAAIIKMIIPLLLSKNKRHPGEGVPLLAKSMLF